MNKDSGRAHLSGFIEMSISRPCSDGITMMRQTRRITEKQLYWSNLDIGETLAMNYKIINFDLERAMDSVGGE